jgi:hypothetical protein
VTEGDVKASEMKFFGKQVNGVWDACTIRILSLVASGIESLISTTTEFRPDKFNCR